MLKGSSRITLHTQAQQKKHPLHSILSSADHEMNMSLTSKTAVFCSTWPNYKEVRAGFWLARSPLTHSCWLHTSKVFEDGRRRAKYSNSHSVPIVEAADRRTVVDCFAVIEGSIHMEHRNKQSGASKRILLRPHPKGSHYPDWLQDLLLTRILLYVAFAS